jgi:serine/threonine protein phosphatase PrpC
MEPFPLVAATLAVTLATMTALFISSRRPLPRPSAGPSDSLASTAPLVSQPKPAEARPVEAKPVEAKPAPTADPAVRPLSLSDPDGDDEDITMVTFDPMLVAAKAEAKPAPTPEPVPAPAPEPARAPSSKPAVRLITRDPQAAGDVSHSNSPLILLSAVAQTHRGRKRKANEDSFVVADTHHLFVVADGMGGYAGGAIASHEAADTIASMFSSGQFGPLEPDVPREGAELVSAIHAANHAILARAHADPKLKGMGTTVVSMRFSPEKMRLCIGHVGDSRAYRLRDGKLEMLTSDHTLAAHGVRGSAGGMLTRAVGIDSALTVDLILERPKPSDVFLLCSDGLTKMVAEEEIGALLVSSPDPATTVQALIQRANENGGKDNITAIVIHVHDAVTFGNTAVDVDEDWS